MATEARFDIVGQDKTAAAFNSVKRNLQNLSQSFFGLQTSIVGLLGAAGLGAFLKSSLEAGDNVQKLSERLGASTEALSQYQYVAKIAGVDFENLSKAWGFLEKTSSDSAVGIGNAQKAYKALGIDIKQFNELRVEDKFETLAAALSQVTNASDRYNLAIKTMGRGASQLLQIIDGGPEKIKQLRAEADRLGLTLNETAARDMAAAKDAVETLESSFQGIGRELAISLSPGIKVFSEMLVSLISTVREVISTFALWSNSFGTVQENLGQFVSYIGSSLAKLSGFSSQGMQLSIFGALIKATDPAKLATLAASTDKVAEATKGYKSAVAGMGIDIDKLGESESAHNKLLQEAKSLYEHVRSPQEAYADNLKKAEQLLNAGLISLTTYNEAMKKYKQDMEDQLDSLAKKGNKDFESLKRAVEGWGRSFTDTLADMLQGKKTFSDLIDSIINDILRISIQRSITDPFVNALFGDPNKPRDSGMLGGILGGGSGSSSSDGGFFSSIGSLFGFAKGGVMSGQGAMPLKQYASGGIANSPQMAMFGEGSMNEAYVPLPDGRSIPVSLSGASNSQPTTMQIQIINQTKTDAQVSTVTQAITAKGMVTQIVLEDIRRGGAISNTLSDAYNLKRNGR
jgi:hypothetical protein